MRRLCFIVVAAAVAALARGGGGSLADSQTLYLSPSGSDSGSCTQASPCQSFSRAYQVADPGATVLVTCGRSSSCRYPAQSIPYTVAKRGQAACRAAETFPDGKSRGDMSGCITFRPATGAKPTVASASLEVPYVQLDGLAFAGMVFAGTATSRVNQPCTTWNVHDLVLHDLDGSGFVFDAVSDAFVLGGSYGPVFNDASKVEPCRNGRSHSDGGHVAIDGVTLHDYRQTQKGVHMECLHFQDGSDSVIVGSRFLNCAQQDLSVQTQGGSHIDGLDVANNVFDAACSHAQPGDVCGVVSGGTTTFICNATGETLTNVTMVSNSLNGSPSFQRQQSCGMSAITVRGNILTGPATSSCSQEQAVGVSYAYNAYTNATGDECGSGNVLGATPSSTWVNPAAYDYRLAAGSPAIGIVPASSAEPSTDIAGSLRPLRWRSDAGAYQRETALVVLGRSIGAAALGQKESAITSFFGRPARVSGQRVHGRSLRRLAYSVHGGVLDVTIDDGRVVALETTSPYYATSAGVGPAASASGLRPRTKATWAKCRRAFRRHYGRVTVQLGVAHGSNRISSISMTRIPAAPQCG